MVVADGKGIPLAVSLHGAGPHEQISIQTTIQKLSCNPARLLGDKAYDSKRLRADLKSRGINLIVPPRDCTSKKVQDGRALRRNRHRWKIERTMSWLGNYRRLVMRWEVNPKMYQAFVHIACALITCRYL